MEIKDKKIRYQISNIIFFSGSESTKNVSDKPEEIYNNSELLSPKDEDQGNLLRGIVICQPCRPWGCHTMDHSDQKCKETSG